MTLMGLAKGSESKKVRTVAQEVHRRGAAPMPPGRTPNEQTGFNRKLRVEQARTGHLVESFVNQRRADLRAGNATHQSSQNEAAEQRRRLPLPRAAFGECETEIGQKEVAVEIVAIGLPLRPTYACPTCQLGRPIHSNPESRQSRLRMVTTNYCRVQNVDRESPCRVRFGIA